MKRNIGLLILIGAASLFGQSALVPSPSDKVVSKVITLKYPNISTAILDGWGLTVKRSGDVIVVIGAQDKVDTAEAILKQLDVPPPPRPAAPPRKDIQLTAFLIIASPSGAQGTPLPKELESAVSQVASIFPYKSFNLFDAIIMRVANNDGGTIGGVLPQNPPQTFPAGGTFKLRVSQISLTDSTPADQLRLQNFSLEVAINRGVDKDGRDKTQNVTLNTNIDMKEGQKIVVGKANIDGSENALIVILTAKEVD